MSDETFFLGILIISYDEGISKLAACLSIGRRYDAGQLRSEQLRDC